MQWWFVVSVVLCSAACSADDLPWWKTAIFYQIYPRSFKDSDGDGVGDLKGITQMADYLAEIGVNAVWLSPIFKSPMADFGYDISNYTMIDPIFGDMDDFVELKNKLQEVNVKLVLDFVPNHSSDEHPWFQKSVNPADPEFETYKDFYVWRNASGYNNGNKSEPLPPNNWMSCFAGIAWQWRQERQQFYLHKFVVKQPDLNYTNPAVQANMTAVINFWIDHGVDGFRMDAVQHIYENTSFPNEPPVNGTAGDTYNTQQHIYTQNQPATFTLLKHWAEVVYQRDLQDGKQRAIFLEVYDDIPTAMKYYGTGNESLEFPFNFFLLTNGNQSTRPAELKQLIDSWMSAMPPGGVANWVIGNHDNGRIADRYGPEMVDSMNLLTGVLPGIKVTYNGEEIGMRNTFIRWDQTVDPSGRLLGPYHYQEGSRDPERTPMQWDSTLSSGFSSNSTPWLPVNPNYWWLNVQAQMNSSASHLKVFQAMAQARKDPVLQRGDLNVTVPDNDTLIIIRSYVGSYFVLVVNMGSQQLSYSSQSLFAPQGLDQDMTVVVASVNSGITPGTNLLKGSMNLMLRPKAAVLLKSGTTPSPSPTPSSAPAAPATASVVLLCCGLLLMICKIR